MANEISSGAGGGGSWEDDAADHDPADTVSTSLGSLQDMEYDLQALPKPTNPEEQALYDAIVAAHEAHGASLQAYHAYWMRPDQE